MITNHLYKYNRMDPDFSRSPLERDLDGMTPIYGDSSPNRHGVTPLKYEITPNGMKTGWRLFKCTCGKEYYAKKTLSQTHGCGKCRTPGGTTRLELIGERYGSLEVVGHERGKGWVVKCDCGRERVIINSTMLASAVYKSCGQCSENERRAASASRGAPPSSLRDAVVAELKAEDELEEQVLGELMALDALCSSDHPLIGYRRSENEEAGGCPLCMAMARIELLEAEADC